MELHADLLVKGSLVFPFMTSCVEIWRTTESSDCFAKLHTWQFGSVHSGAFRLAWSDGRLETPAMCRSDAWYLLSVARNVDTRGLAENSPLLNFSYPCTQGLLSVSTQANLVDWIIYGLKCLTATAMARASTSHGSHVAWP